jgi:DNA-damage-inducible protein J
MDYNVSAAPKSEIFHFRINPEVKRQVEEVYAKNGLSFTQAINVFIQQSLNVGGFPFLVSSDNAELLKAAALKKLMCELEQGKQSGECLSNEVAIKMLDVDKL